MSTSQAESTEILKQEMVEVAALLASSGFHAALAGNLSARLGADRLLCTAHGADKRSLRTADLIICDLDGRRLEGSGWPTSEMQMHLAAYRERADVGAVIHAHPPTATAFAAASRPLDRLQLPEMVLLLGPVALVPYATPGTEDLAAVLRDYLRSHDAFLLENHGALSLGHDLRQAGQRMELIEQNARVTLTVEQLGQPFRLNHEQAAGLERLGKKLSAY